MDGLLVIDKPKGVTSFDVVGRVRSAVGMSKVGHMGTLDKAATGLLAVMLGRCTKLQKFLGEKVSTYEFSIEFGTRTDTLDTNGEVVAECEWEHVSAEAIREALESFVGTIEQKPPQYSAVKIDGRRASEWARDDDAPTREPEPREVEIRSLELLEFDPPTARMRIECVSGTYVRSVVRDLAGDLKSCAHATGIRRVASNTYSIEDTVPLDELDEQTAREALLAPVEMVAELPSYHLDSEEARLVSYGTQLTPPADWLEASGLEEGDPVRLIDEEEELAAVARLRHREEGLELQPRRVMKPAQ